MLRGEGVRIKKSFQSAFTLIELSIVLVIIGLVVGGVFVGRDLIHAAFARAQITQMITLETQIHAFKTKYGCLPGDCVNATSFLPATFVGPLLANMVNNEIRNGDGDGIIRAVYGTDGPFSAPECLQGAGSDEPSQLFAHLVAANLGSYKASAAMYVFWPYAKLDNGTSIFISCLNGVVYPGFTPTFLINNNIMVIAGGGAGSAYGRIGYATGLYSWTGYGYIGLSHAYMSNIDTKIDNGLPSSGNVGVISSSPSNVGACSTASNSYNTSSLAFTCMVVGGKIVK